MAFSLAEFASQPLKFRAPASQSSRPQTRKNRIIISDGVYVGNNTYRAASALSGAHPHHKNACIFVMLKIPTYTRSPTPW